MRIGVTLDDERGLSGNVCAHFGQCKFFLIVDVDENKKSIIKTEVVPNLAVHGGGGCLAVTEILKYKVTHVISGGMGMGAQQKFEFAGVKIFGCLGNVEDAIKSLLLNSLGGIEACKEHGDCH